MKKLDIMFNSGGWTFTQVKRVDREGLPSVAIYEKRKKGVTRPSYETIIILKHKAHTFPTGKSIGPGELYPGNNQWGNYGFTSISLLEAEERLEKIINPTVPTRRRKSP